VNSNPVYYKSLGASPYVQNDEILPKPGYRLAAVSEWQFAYRAGTDGDYYWAGDRYMELLAKEYAWFGGSVEDPQVTPYGPDTVAHRRPNPWGLFDMAGNVAEFVRGADNSCLLGTIAAGGSWGEELRYLTYASVDNMGCAVSHSHTETFGFRCVRIIKD
jgi:sulfatase modifying factor 1